MSSNFLVRLSVPVAVLMVWLLSTSLVAAATRALDQGPYLFVETAGTQNAHVITIPDHEVIKSFDVEPEVYDIIGSNDGTMLYINHGVGKRTGRRFPESSALVARDIHTLEVQWTVDIPDGWAHHSAISHDDRFLYMPIFDRPYTLIVDLEKAEVVARLHGDHGGHVSEVSPDGKRLYVGTIFTETLLIKDLEDREAQPKRIQLNNGLRNFAFPTDESVVYQQLSGFHGFVIVDPSAGRPIRTVPHPYPGREKPAWSRNWPYKVDNGVAMSPDEKYVLFAASAFDKVLVYSHPGAGLVAEIETGENPSWIVVSDDSRFAYVTCQSSNEVSVISLTDMVELKRIKLPGEMPARMNVINVAGR